MGKPKDTTTDDDKEKAKEIDEEVEEKTEKVEKEIKKASGERVNVIGEIKDVKKPDPNDPDDVRTYFKKIDEKLSKLLDFHAPKKDPEETPDPEPNKTIEEKKKRSWFDVEII